MRLQSQLTSYWKYSFTVSILSAILAAIFIARYQIYPSTTGRADAWSYQFYAFRFREHGIFYDFGTVRTYGYPLFLYILSFLSGFDHNRLSLAAGTVQFGLFFTAVHWLTWLTRRASRRLALAILIGLLLNPFVLALVTDALTDGLSIVLYVMLAGLAVRFGQSTKHGAITVLFVGGFVAAAALIVRPANIVVVVAWYLSVAIVLGGSPVFQGRRFLSLAVAASLLTAGVAWAPQFVYNLINYGEATFLPVCKLGEFQAEVGVVLWKYDSIVSSEAVGPWYYLNPLLNDNLPTQGAWRWYFENPLVGIVTILAHLFNAFSVTSLFTYIWNPNPIYGLPLRLFYWALHIGGIMGIVRYLHLLVQGQFRAGAMANALALVFVSLSTLGVIALNSVTAVEVRFNAIPIAALCVIAIASLLGFLSGESPFRWRIAIPCFAVALVCFAGSYAMDRLGTADAGNRIRAFDPIRNRCFLVGQGGDWTEAVKDYEALMRIHRDQEQPL